MAITTQDSKTAAVLSSGVLNELVEQVTDGSPSYNYTSQTFTCKFKGPYSILKDANQMVDNWLTTALHALSINVTRNFNFPTPPEGTNWWVVSTSVEQLEAGDHAIVTITSEARDANYTPSGDGTFDPYADTWQLRWESYTVKPAAFCSNKEHSDYAITDPNVEEGHQLTGFASREHIDMFVNGNDKGVSKGHRWYRDDTGQAWYLNDAENYIINKTLEDKSALWHYPVLTHITQKNFNTSNISAVLSNNISYDESIGNQIDYIVGGSANPSAAPKGCPYTFDGGWMWVKTGDDMAHVKTKGRISFQRTETYMGVISADINYYGDVAFNHNNLSACRWKPGEL